MAAASSAATSATSSTRPPGSLPRAASTVVSLNDRLAPENPYPAGLHDVRDTLDWLREHTEETQRRRPDRGRRTECGSRARRRRLPARAGTGYGGPRPSDSLLPEPRPRPGHQVVPAVRRHVPAASPLVAGPRRIVPRRRPSRRGRATPSRHLRRFPPALVLAAGRDPLRDDARTEPSRPAEDGVPARLVEYAGTMHAFLNFPAVLSAGRHAVELIGADLAQCSAHAADKTDHPVGTRRRWRWWRWLQLVWGMKKLGGIAAARAPDGSRPRYAAGRRRLEAFSVQVTRRTSAITTRRSARVRHL